MTPVNHVIVQSRRGPKYLYPASPSIRCFVERRGIEIGAHKHPANQVGEEADGLNATLRRDRDGLPVLARILCGVERGSIVPLRMDTGNML